MDSGASSHFTIMPSDFTDLNWFQKDKRPQAITANGVAEIHGHATVFIETKTDIDEDELHLIRLDPVYLMKGMEDRLMSMGQILHDNNLVQGDQLGLYFYSKRSMKPFLSATATTSCHPLFKVETHIMSGEALSVLRSVNKEDFDLWHHRLGHPGDQTFDKFKSQTEGIPFSVKIPSTCAPCKACREGKAQSRSFPENPFQATQIFEWIHSDLKSYSTKSYSKYGYIISFIDNFSSHAWITLLCKKSDALEATRHFLAMVKTQHDSKVLSWMSDNGGEYIDGKYEEMLKESGIKIQKSAPNQPQMNG